MIGDAEYRFAAEFQQQDEYGRKTLVKNKPGEVYTYIHTYMHVYILYAYGYIHKPV